jgi:4-hydroxy-3-methylbut-2-enyl diphosphate reductase
VVQSTQNLKTVKEIAAALRKQIKKLEFFNTVCVPTRLKQEEIRKMPLENQAMVIVGSKTSANTKRLYQISKKLNKNTHWVNSAKEINRQWFKGISSVGVTAGASTPRQATEKVLKYLKKIGRD